MKPTHPCTRNRLSTSGIGNVDACSCGMVHVNVGATTLRFTHSAFQTMAAMIRQAAAAEAAADPLLAADPRRVQLGELSRGQA
jgi:hypothetical protein